MISRIWHGWTTFSNADSYESLLKTEIFIGIQDRNISGYRGIQLFRRKLQDEMEFVTVMWFDTIDDIKDSKKRRSSFLVALLFAAGDARR
ncbi:MAG: hypothetical protein M1550_04430 [Deltaproteobacteria bacterium]|nr:hypothetical protein [Deltaproteobacteria bacterium]